MVDNLRWRQHCLPRQTQTDHPLIYKVMFGTFTTIYTQYGANDRLIFVKNFLHVFITTLQILMEISK